MHVTVEIESDLTSTIGAAPQTGTAGNDTMTGTSNNDVLKGLDGDDRIDGYDGNDRLYGGQGNDQLYGGNGNDRLFGGNGNDNLVGGDGDDYLNPGDNNYYDSIDAGRGDDIVDFSDLTPGDAYVDLHHSSHFVLTQGISVNINGNTNTGSVNKGNSGTTTIINVANALEVGSVNGGLGVFGTEFADTFRVNVGDNGWMLIRGGAGADSYQINGNSGFVRLDFSGAANSVRANLSKGIIYNDGHGNREVITGTGAVSELRSSMNNDTITGSSKDEHFILRAGTDVLDGRGGNDSSRYDRYGVDSVNADLEAGTATGVWLSQSFNHTLRNIESLRGSRFGDDTLRGTDGKNTILARGGDDTLVGRGGNDFLNGEDGNDFLDGGAGNDTLIGDGIANYFYSLGSFNAGRDTLLGGKGDDLLNGGANADVLNGGGGTDTASYEDATSGVRVDLAKSARNTGEAAGDSFVSVENLLGSTKGDRLSGDNGKNKINGDRGNDRLDGLGGADTLIGGNGNDRLDGGKGNDRQIGGAGNDTFIFSAGDDVITDFDTTNNKEKIDLRGVASITGINDLKANHVTETGSKLVIDDLGGNTLTLNGVSIADLDKGDFIF